MMTRTFLCPPTFYDVTYSINPYMDPSVKVDRVLAWRQWSRFVDALEGRGLDLLFIEPRDGCPDMVFLGDAGLVLGDRFLCSRFRHRERQPEADHYTQAFGHLGYRVIQPPRVRRPRGARRYHDLGRPRHPRIRPALGSRRVRCVPPVRAVRRRRCRGRAARSAFLPSRHRDRVSRRGHDPVLPGCVHARGPGAARARVGRAIAVGERDILDHQACNCLVLGDTVMMDGCSSGLERELAGCGFRVETYPMSEFKKGGGSLRCLVLPSLSDGQAATVEIAS